MKNFFTTLAQIAIIGISHVNAAQSATILTPPRGASGPQVGVVWIHGADCPTAGYEVIAKALQKEGIDEFQVYVAIPEFTFSPINPDFLNKPVDNAIAQLKASGFTGDKVFMAAHSLGGVVTQKYIAKHPENIAGGILMGSALLRSNHSLNADGTTHMDYPVPVLTVGGTKDGLMRVSRVAESFFHQVENIEAAQAGLFPVVAYEGVAHMSYTSGAAPDHVLDYDLIPDLDEATAHKLISQDMIAFFNSAQEGKGSVDETSHGKTVKPFIDAMKMEGFNKLKPNCKDTIDATCLAGSPWVEEFAQPILAGDDLGMGRDVQNTDYFNGADPAVTSACNGNDENSPCTVQTTSTTSNSYDIRDKSDAGQYPIASLDMKIKMSSRKAIQNAAGKFSTEQAVDACKAINDASIGWALSQVSYAAKDNYYNYGERLETSADVESDGSLSWGRASLDFAEDEGNTTNTVTAQYHLSTGKNGVHYCHALSPFRAMEIIYIDSLYFRNSIMWQSTNGLFLQ